MGAVVMGRRAALAGLLGGAGIAVRPARAHTAAAASAHWLEADGAALMLARFHPAGGPLDRHGARPGAWWQLLYAPLQPGWPVELQLRAQRRGHALQVVALDAPPAEAPNVAAALPLWADSATAPARWSSRFVLPARSAADGVFLMVELWRADFASPPPLTIRLRSVAYTGEALRASTAPPAERVDAPLSPLTQAQRERGAFELPVFAPRVAPAVVPLQAWPQQVPR